MCNPEFQCSSASRKFLNFRALIIARRRGKFQCSSASRKFLNPDPTPPAAARRSEFQCSSASRKFLNRTAAASHATGRRFQCSSASRKFLNIAVLVHRAVDPEFQCSSASRKFLNCINTTNCAPRAPVSVLFSEPKIPQPGWWTVIRNRRVSFSALQRAENSSTRAGVDRRGGDHSRFSALQRAENSSTGLRSCTSPPFAVSVLFSEPKIPQRASSTAMRTACKRVSVLFSEPKIPQLL